MNVQATVPKATIGQVCRAFGFSRPAWYAAAKREREGVAKRTRRATPPKYASTAEVRSRIEAIVAENPAWGFRKVFATLKRKGIAVGRNRVIEVMRSLGALFPARESREEVARGHVAVPEPNRRWATDGTCVPTRVDGLVWIFPVIDCGCRSVLDTEVTTSPNVDAALSPLEWALAAEFGAPDRVPAGLELRTDQGSVYTARLFENVMQAWRIDHTFTPVGRPTGNAVAERVIRTLKEECLWLRDWNTAEEIRAAVAAWCRRYNGERPHQALDWHTPAERRAERLRRAPQLGAA